MSEPVYVFLLLGSPLAAIPEIITKVMRHPAVGGYQIGFGPPLVKANPRVVDALKTARSPFEKLEIYFRHCLLDPKERVRLTWRHRAMVTQRLGPLEAEEVALHYADALDLVVTLREQAPAGPPGALGEVQPSGGARSGRFLLRFDDLANDRLLELPALAGRVPAVEPFALELRVAPAAEARFQALLQEIEGVTVVALGDPASLARARRDGVAY
ncbi:MAG: hypothetical protein U1E65_18110 [Myxococcota bacterium]